MRRFWEFLLVVFGVILQFIDFGFPATKKPHEKVGRPATLFLAKSVSDGGVGGCPDLRRFADHSGGTVADSHGLPRFPNLQIVDWQSKSPNKPCQLWT